MQTRVLTFLGFSELSRSIGLQAANAIRLFLEYYFLFLRTTHALYEKFATKYFVLIHKIEFPISEVPTARSHLVYTVWFLAFFALVTLSIRNRHTQREFSRPPAEWGYHQGSGENFLKSSEVS